MPTISVRVDVSSTIAGFAALKARLDEATRQIAADAAHIVQAHSMREAPVGVAGNSTNAPGDLRRSIFVTGPHGGDGTYVARVGPTVVYGRQRELGGAIYPQRALALAFNKFGTRYVVGPGVVPRREGNTVFIRRPGVYQEPNPYMLRGEMGSLGGIVAAARMRVAGAIAGS